MNKLIALVRALATDLIDLVAPPTCAACKERFPPRPPLCALCRGHLMPAEDPPPHVFVAFDHGGPLARAIHQAKYGGDPSVAASLGSLLSESLPTSEEPVDLIVPVPLHPKRLRSRGFNQSAELSRCLSRRLGAELLFEGARRLRDTPTQTRLTREARRENVAGAFVVSERVRGRRVLLVDDVVTTGSTLAALRQAALDAGAATVRAVALARAPLYMR